MTYLFTETPSFFSDICEEIRLFIDTRRIECAKAPARAASGLGVEHFFSLTDGLIASTAKVLQNGETAAEYIYRCPVGSGTLVQKRTAKRAVKISVYRALAACFGVKMPWGSLTGIRPTKLLRDSEAALGEEGARSLFINEFDVSPEKYGFAKSVVDIQKPLMPKACTDIDVYIGIPFCVSRCAYCSFASNTLDVFPGAEGLYMDALAAELSGAETLLLGKQVRAMYIGGGTPTALGDEHFETLLKRAAKIASGAKEFTVEAGRPDTITPQKLRAIKAAGAGRISVNAQTLVDDTLLRIGRHHTAAQFFDAYGMARKTGLQVNVDLIAGLPGESQRDFTGTLEKIISLDPENITVHTLAVKRASAFAAANLNAFPTDTETAKMLCAAQRMLEAAGYHPYYMYRQKYMKGSLENAGYAKDGKACLYNIDNMEELLSVAAFGAGAISKRVYGGGERIERAANLKDLRIYIARVGEMARRKQALFSG
ncbi:MAG: coproporphyrinogen dehydrogenase HemZ [Christensenellales bacterium]|jgi:coproporphyrinogen dehydrogenase HemZ